MVISYANKEQVKDLFATLTPRYRYNVNGVTKVMFVELMEAVAFEKINEDAWQFIADSVVRYNPNNGPSA